MSWRLRKFMIPYLAAFVTIIAAGAGILIYSIRNEVMTSTPYRETIRWIDLSQEAAKQIGPIKRHGYFPYRIFRDQKESAEAMTIIVPVEGNLKKARIKTIFGKKEGGWIMTEALLMPSKGLEWIPLLPLEISAPAFPGGNKIFESGEGISWKIEARRVSKKNGAIHLMESLTVVNEKNEAIIDEPNFLDQQRQAEESTLLLENLLTPLPAGKYKLRLKVSDLLAEREAFIEDEITVVHSRMLKISDLDFKKGGGGKILVTFNVIGFKINEGSVSLTEDLYVMDESGDVALSKPEILAVGEKWEKGDMMPLQNDLVMPVGGNYTLKIVINDRHSGGQFVSLSPFKVD